MTVSLTAAPPAGATRVSLRTVTDGVARDVVGWVLGVDGDHLVVLPADTGPQWIRKDSVEARREVPPRLVLPASNPLDLERVTTLGWPGVERFRLGGWLLRAGGGWTGRANSCLIAGDPGLPTEDALAAVVAFYRHRGVVPRLQITLEPDGSPVAETRSPGPTVAEVDAAAQRGGWRSYDHVQVLVCDTTAAVPPDLPEGVRVGWTERPDDAWLALARGGEGANPAAVDVLTAANARYLTLVDGDQVVAVGRSAEAEGWVGFSCVEVHPEHRRRGWGRLLTQVLLASAESRYAYVQVVADNAAALALYEPFGFELHHGYRYRLLDA